MSSDPKTAGPRWWDRPVAVTRGQIVIGIVTWMLLDLIAKIVRHL